ncbi:autotransporter assembly complex protein TamA [Aestuariibius sp. 2305UL40-4]|uniref:autotransporter assembly complex protein TamA n=1 Tax=Aestuariibius violaceus TaxID=3234132 RepID=UPI00345E7346
MRTAILCLFALCVAPATAVAQEVSIRTGDAPDDLKNLLKANSLLFGLEDTDQRNPQDYVAAANADYARMVETLYQEGYFGGTVRIEIDGREAETIPPLQPPASIRSVIIRVDPGPRFTFGRTRIAPLPRRTEIPEAFATGLPAETDAIRQSVRTGITAWREDGHAKAAIAEESVIARHDQSRLDVNVRLDPGPRLTFGRLIIEGNQNVRTERVRAIAGLPEGEVFSQSELDRAEERLRRTGTFSSAALIEADQIAPGGSLPITAQIAERLPRRFGFGAEVSSDQGVSLSAFWLHRNLLGGAERLRVEGEISGLGGTTGGQDYVLTTTFNRPATFSSDTDLYALASIEERDEPEFFSRQVRGEIGLTRYVNDRVTVSAGVGFRIGETEDDLGERDYTYITFPVSGEWDRRDNVLNPTEGFYLEADAIPFLAVSDTDSGGRVDLDARYYLRPLATDRVVLAFRGQLGSLLGPPADEAPADFLYFSGGGGTVRGQEFQSLGVEVDGDTTGGRSFLGASAEARVGVTDRISVVGFYDYGFIGPDSFYSDEGDDHAGAGLGIRYDTGIGPIRLDVGTPVSGGDDDDSPSIQVYIGIGQAF